MGAFLPIDYVGGKVSCQAWQACKSIWGIKSCLHGQTSLFAIRQKAYIHAVKQLVSYFSQVIFVFQATCSIWVKNIRTSYPFITHKSPHILQWGNWNIAPCLVEFASILTSS
jgi:hypothetical protein